MSVPTQLLQTVPPNARSVLTPDLHQRLRVRLTPEHRVALDPQVGYATGAALDRSTP